ncbi:MAG: MBL fold metallo-hydrolase [Oscillospiraceae bacterium]|nr:MBL fold metallo-hydrolase [Oscillospiraceae bacterium]
MGHKLIVLGTGNAGALKCYNTCFVLQNKDEYLLVDGGGGNRILSNLADSNIDVTSIHNIFVSHNHLDHIIGIVWVIRKIAQMMWSGDQYEGILNIYSSNETTEGLEILCKVLLNGGFQKYIGDRIRFNQVYDRQELEVAGYDVMFIDIKTKRSEKQFGFKAKLGDTDYLTFLGDRPCSEDVYEIVKDSKWLLHESACLDKDKDKVNPHKKGHCTVKEASEIAEKLNIKNLVLWHTEESDLANRKHTYTKEAKQYFQGNVYVPNDLEVIEL